MPLPSLAAPLPPLRMSHALAASALALLLGLQPVSTDIYLPALPMLARDLAAPMGQVQLTMSALMLAFGLAQMVWGPVSDRIGRRPVLLAGLVLYAVASVGCVLAGRIETLVVWRALQGAAMAAAVVCARAILRDLYAPAEGAQVMALALSGLGMMALAGPVLGGALTAAWGWRAPLALVATVGALTLLFVALRLPETLAQCNPHATRFWPLLRLWGHIGRHPVFRAFTLLVACTYGGLFTILAASPFIYMGVLGLSPAAYGAVMALGSFSYILGTVLCRRWIARHGIAGTVARGGAFTLAAGLLMAGLAAAGVQAVWAVLLPQCLFVFAHGLHQPCGQAGVVGPFPQAAGSASALAGLVLALVAFAIGRWLGVALDAPQDMTPEMAPNLALGIGVRPLAYGLCFWAVLTCTVAWTLVPRATR